MTGIPDRNTMELQIIVITPPSRRLLVVERNGQFELIRVSVRRGTRLAKEVSVSLKREWDLTAFILEILFAEEGSPACVIAELLECVAQRAFGSISLEQLVNTALSERQLSIVNDVVTDRIPSPICRIGWYYEAVSWVEEITNRRVARGVPPEQLNSGRGFALICFLMEGGERYWLKAASHPNEHEYNVTACLCTLCPECLPLLVATKKEWNAWLTRDAGLPWSDAWSSTRFARVTRCLLQLQHKTIRCTDRLIASGASDHRLPVLHMRIDQIMDHLAQAMSRQTSTRSAPVSKRRLLELGEIMRDICACMGSLGIPNTLLHNDLNVGNILFNVDRCVFTDWSEAAVGIPFVSFDRLCAQNHADTTEAETAYTNAWLPYLSQSAIEQAMALTPLLAIYSYLHGRGDWTTRRDRQKSESYDRSLARHMDKAAQNPRLLEVLRR